MTLESICQFLGNFSLRNELNYRKWDLNGYDEDLIVERVTFGKRLFKLDHFFGLSA